MIEGVDYSSRPAGAPSPATLLAAGKRFACRYLADDFRGITSGEYLNLTHNGVDVVAVFESWGDQREFSGEIQGVLDATFAQGKLLRTGMPATMPIYFATDWDAQSWDMAAIDAYLRGAGKVLGAGRVGVYGGLAVIDHCHANGSAQWFWQTSAWSGGEIHPQAHLYQHAYNHWIDDTNCDDTDALQTNYGQASAFVVPPTPAYPAPVLPSWYARVNGQKTPSRARWGGTLWEPKRENVTALADTYVYVEPDTKSAHAGAMIAKGSKVGLEWIFAGAGQHLWGVNSSGYYYLGKFSPELHLSEPR